MPQTAVQLLNDLYGYDSFRGHQAEIVDQVTAGHDALVLMPTGGGKSLWYQIPSLLRDGVGVIISPLIALMQDQVNAMQQLGIKATFSFTLAVSGRQFIASRHPPSWIYCILHLSVWYRNVLLRYWGSVSWRYCY